MSIYIRELLIDLADNKLDADSKVDLLCGLEYLHSTGQINIQQVNLIDSYISGYSLIELQQGTQNAGELIISALALLEDYTQYTDETAIQYGIRIYPKYSKTIDAFRNKCQDLSREL